MAGRFDSLGAFLRGAGPVLARGPAALILAEDPVEVGSTLRHHLDVGFRAVVLFAPADLDLSEGDRAAAADPRVTTVNTPTTGEGAMP
ncbi:MAG: hypothetical protein IT542_12470, partial [Rubellimicrobium sp.]|nr:hypothetical protein [Rubellimicrobium sp.]